MNQYNILNNIEHKKSLINLYKIDAITFSGSLFTQNIKMKLKDNYPREIIIKFYSSHTDEEVTNLYIIKNLYDRLKLKLIIQEINFINNNHITLYKNNYKVYFFQEDTYGDIHNPIMLTDYEIYKLLSYEKDKLKIN